MYKKRILCLLLALVVLMQYVPIHASAVQDTDPPEACDGYVFAYENSLTFEAGSTNGYTKVKYGSNKYLNLADSGFTTGANDYEVDLSEAVVIGGNTITVNGGRLGTIFGTESSEGNVNIVINGGYVECLYATSYGTERDVNVTVNGGRVVSLFPFEGYGDIIGKYSVHVSGGAVEEIYSYGIVYHNAWESYHYMETSVNHIINYGTLILEEFAPQVQTVENRGTVLMYQGRL